MAGNDPRKDSSPFVFLDPSGKRWPRLRITLLLAGVALFLAVVWFIEALFVRPELRLPPSVRKLKGQLKALQQQAAAPNPAKIAPWQKFYPKSQAAVEHITKLREQLHENPQKKFTEIRLGFCATDDRDSYLSLEKHAGQLTHVCTDWLTVTDGAGTLHAEEDLRIERLAVSRGLILMPMLNNLVENSWKPEAIENLASGPADRQNKFVINLLSRIEEAKAGGVVIDWEQLDPVYQQQFSDFLKKIADALHAVDKQLWLVVPMGDEMRAYDLETLADSVDYFIAQLFDENSDVDDPGPLASQDWLEGWLALINSYGNPDQWIGAIGAYGYDWTAGTKKAELISFSDAMSRASYAGIQRVDLQGPDYNPMYSYQEPGGNHTVCFLDAVSFLNHLRAIRSEKLGGIAISRLGSEDPGIWDVLSIKDVQSLNQAAVNRLQVMKSADTVTNVGRGEIVTVDDAQDNGFRRIMLDASKRYTADYEGSDPDPQKGFPTYPIIYHEGAGGDHDVALTFDDGPDPKWTPQVLDILKAKNAKAAFFLVGREAEQYPKLVERIVAEGHEIGNHTYTHPNLSEISAQQIRLELNATQRLIESITRRSTTLFRPPYNADSRPSDILEIRPLKQVQDELGYLIVLENIDPEDWGKPGASVILQRIKELRHLGSIILLHDGGGNRSQTVEALPQIIDWLRTRGDRIVSLGELMNIPRDDLMPPVKGNVAPVTRIVTGAGFMVWHAVEQFVWAFMIVATGLIVLRTIIVALLASFHHHKMKRAAGKPYYPPVTIIVAAYNEGRVVRATLRSVVDTDYRGAIEVLVVNDGSTDDTSGEVRKAAFIDDRIRLIEQPNGGKSAALCTGFAAAQHDILVFLDADTHFERTTLTELVLPLADLNVGAVSGHAKVGNLRTFIARCQSLEYICGFNLDRRAYCEWDCITVAPGAISALRRSAVEDAGGFSTDTLAEDTDLTLCLHKKGYRIEYAPDAVAWTEAPESLRTLAKQRFRWAFGTLQCLFKHKDLVFNPSYKALGWFSLPGVWFFQIILVAIAPVVDLLLILSLITGGAVAMWSYFITFLAMDLILAMLACWLDDEKLRSAWIIIPMRLIYRPLLSFVIWRAIFKATKGVWVTWGKLERTASVVVRT